MFRREVNAIIKSRYKKGVRIRLIKMGGNDPRPIEPGSTGTVDFVDDAGQIHMLWDNGRSLAIVPGVDEFVVTC